MSGVIHAVTHPASAIKHLVHNPASAIVPKPVRDSSIYKNVVRPVVKVGTGAAAGFVTSGGNPLGAVAGGITSAIGGGLTNNAFRPLPNLVGPAVVGGAFNPAVKNFANGIYGPSTNIPTKAGYILRSTPGIGGGTPASAVSSSSWLPGTTGINAGGSSLGSIASGIGNVLGGGGSSGGIGGTGIGWGDVLNTGAQIAGAIYGSNSAQKAAQAQANAAARANQTTMAMFNQNRADLAPWRQVGGGGLTQLGAETLGPNAPLTRRFGTADFQADPGYQFRKSEGQKAIDHRLAAMGMNQSGHSVKEAARFNQGLADQAYQGAYNRFNADQTNRFNRLNTLSNTGVNAAGRVANLGANAAQAVANNQVGIGNANAAGKIGSSNAYLNALNNIQQIGANNRFNNAIGGIG